MKNYLSVVYDLTQFGVYHIKNAIVTADMDEGVEIKVSFDGGSSFYPINSLNEKFPVENSKGKVQVKISFPDIVTTGIYKVKAIGFFPNLEIGTTIYFTSNNGKTFKTNIGENGRYSISLPRGLYSIYYLNRNEKVILMENFNPEVKITQPSSLNKENTIEIFLRSVEWANYVVFDTFEDSSKMKSGSAIIDPDGNLSDGLTDRKVRYWAIGFN